MSKKNIVMIVVLLALIAIYIVNFTTLFQSSTIEIATRVRPQIVRHGRSRTTTVDGTSTSFLLNGKYELTSVKVVEEADAKTNKYPHALWHLVSESNSVPTKALFYGVPIKGMKPEIAKTKPEPLQTNVSYVLMLEAGNVKGETTFQIH